jgi:hypothetical protein
VFSFFSLWDSTFAHIGSSSFSYVSWTLLHFPPSLFPFVLQSWSSEDM